jgi:hypothetical protein
MNTTVKEIWKRRTAVERILLNAKLPAAEAQRLAEAGEAVWDAFVDYQITRKRKWDELGLGNVAPDDEAKADKAEREAKIAEFNDAMAIEAQADVPVPFSVGVKELPSLICSSVDMMAMRDLGVIRWSDG